MVKNYIDSKMINYLFKQSGVFNSGQCVDNPGVIQDIFVGGGEKNILS